MNKIKKFLKKISNKERRRIELVILMLKNHIVYGLDITKIQGTKYNRLRLGRYRITYFYKNGRLKVKRISHRNNNTYKNL